MKKIINNKEQIVDDMLSGYVKANSERIKLSKNNKRIILRSQPKSVLTSEGKLHLPMSNGAPLF